MLFRSSTFWFDLPLKSDGYIEQQPESAETWPDDKSGIFADTSAPRVLLAEDSHANQLIIRTYLLKAGMQVDIASDGKEALQQAKEFPYDLILMDVSMPEMDGIEATEILRNQQGLNSNTPVIMLTAHALPEIKERCAEAGATSFLTKPVSRDQLLTALHETLKLWGQSKGTE